MTDILVYLNQLDRRRADTKEILHFLSCIAYVIDETGIAGLGDVSQLFFDSEAGSSYIDCSARLLKSKSYMHLRDLGYLRIRKSNEHGTLLALSGEAEFARGSKTVAALKALSFPANSTNAVSGNKEYHLLAISGTTENRSGRAALTTLGRLNRRIENAFVKATYIGDIPISDDEYQLLLQTLRLQYARICAAGERLISPLVCVALVQIGIHRYIDGNYWGNMADELATVPLSGAQQRSFGRIFLRTMKHYNKSLIGDNAYVSNIMMHTYVCSYYAKNYFEFLFKYYNLDLDRDITRLTREEMNALVETIKVKSGADRSYLLAQQVCSAVIVNPMGSKTRIRRHLQTIDRCFFDDGYVITSRNRIYGYLSKWISESESFKSVIADKIRSGNGRRSFSSPYLFCELGSRSFSLMLPTQLLRTDRPDDMLWRIQTCKRTFSVPIELFAAITGYKTGETNACIDADELLGSIRVAIEDEHGDRLRSFIIKEQDVRFFNADGVHINARVLQTGEAWAFSASTGRLDSTALLDTYIENGLRVSYLCFEYLDTLRLPRGKMLIIGKQNAESGFVGKGLMENAYAVCNGTQYSLYNALPRLILKLQSQKADGTRLIINGSVRRLMREDTAVFSLEDRSNDTGYCLTLSEDDCPADGMYEITVDVPGERNSCWKFFYIRKLYARFDGAPYIFSSRGSIALPDSLSLSCDRSLFLRDGASNVFMFELSGDRRETAFTVDLSCCSAELHFIVPALFWRFDGGRWNVGQPSEIWHRNFPTIIELSVPWHKVSVCLEEDTSAFEHYDDDTLVPKPVNGIRIADTQTFLCDVTQFKSFFVGAKLQQTLFIDFNNEHIEFAHVITSSLVTDCLLSGDYKTGALTVKADIIGGAEYFADVFMGDRAIFNRVLLNHGRYTAAVELQSGLYKVVLYEYESDSTGFGGDCFNELRSFETHLVNPYDMRGRSFEVMYSFNADNPLIHTVMYMKYYVKNLAYASSGNRSEYTGTMVVSACGKDYAEAAYPVSVTFPDLEQLSTAMITYIDGDDQLSFILDARRRILVKNEDLRVRNPERYRRFVLLDPDSDLFSIHFINEVAIVDHFAPDDVPLLEDADPNTMCIRWKTEQKHESPAHAQRKASSPAKVTPIEKRKSFAPPAKDIWQSNAQGSYASKRKEEPDTASSVAVSPSRNDPVDEYGFLSYRTEDVSESGDRNVHNSSASPFSAEEKALIATRAISVSACGLPPLIYNCLKHNGLSSLGDIADLLEQKGERGFQSIQKCTAEMKKEIANTLRRYDLYPNRR